MKTNQLYGSTLILCLCIVIGCGGGGDDGGTPTISDWGITIETPSTESTISSNCESIYIGGQAPISSRYSRCCSYSADDTGVVVNWENTTNGSHGASGQSVEVCHLFGTPHLCNHQWSATIPLVIGDNKITVTAHDSSGALVGRHALTITKRSHTYTVSGRVTTSLGVGIGNIRIDMTRADSGSSPWTSTDINGNYTCSCMENGSYTVTPSSTVNYVFVPDNLHLLVSNADVTAQDFVTEAYTISGTLINPPTLTPVTLNSSSYTMISYPDSSGHYFFTVPNGSYTIVPASGTVITYTPASRDVTVDHADMSGQDFVH